MSQNELFRQMLAGFQLTIIPASGAHFITSLETFLEQKWKIRAMEVVKQ